VVEDMVVEDSVERATTVLAVEDSVGQAIIVLVAVIDKLF